VTSKIERRLIGIVEVDSGLVMISDPAYVLPRAEEKQPGVDYSVVLRDASNKPAVQLDGQGVVLLANFGGDGPCPLLRRVRRRRVHARHHRIWAAGWRGRLMTSHARPGGLEELIQQSPSLDSPG
jgi:hypothetical protein